MKKYLFLTSALVAFTMSGVVEAACIQTPSCSSLGYASRQSCTGGIKCPFGNAWNCTTSSITNKITELTNKIITLETKVTELQKDTETSNCQIGDILYSDMSCSQNLYQNKKPIGVVFDRALKRAMALDIKCRIGLAHPNIDISNIPTHTEENSAKTDYDGKENTNKVWKACQSYPYEADCPALEYVNSYKSEGTKAGDWYIPSAGEMNTIYLNREVLNTTLNNMGAFPLQSSDDYLTSTLKNAAGIWVVNFSARGELYGETYFTDERIDTPNHCARPVLAF